MDSPSTKRIRRCPMVTVWAILAIPKVGGVLALADILFVFRDDRRCLHDQIAGTRVVEYRAPDAPSGAY